MMFRISFLLMALVVAVNGKKTKRFPLSSTRSYNGTEAIGGSAHSQLIRIAAADYPLDSFGVNSGEKIREGPNPREISNAVMKQTKSKPNNRDLSDIVWAWGQFIDHDMDLTEPDQQYGVAPIRIPDENDILYGGPPQGMIPFTRSVYNISTGISSQSPRQQLNAITALIDGSGVYGSDEERARSLRTFNNGKMNMTLVSSRGNKVLDLLPRDGSGMFLAGDIRANEQVGLISMHTLFLREHNRLCDRIKKRFGGASDEQIYQLARKIVAGELQAITYNEFLRALLGPMAPTKYKGYDKRVDPSIATEFSTVAFRFGHSMLSPELQLYFKNRHFGEISLREAFFQPDFLVGDPINVDYLIGGFVKQRAQEVDHMIIDDVRNFLFGKPGTGGFDLAALNIQRGRDHGIPTYNKVRAAYKLSPNKHWKDVSSNKALRKKLASVYNSPDEMDAWVGGLCEDHVRGASVGELIGTVIRDQFTRVRDGDPFFYLIDKDLQDWSVKNKIQNVNTVTLADVIRANTQIQNINNKNVFFVQK